MPESLAILFSALIAGGLSLAAMFLNERLQMRRRAEEAEERFLYAVYNRRVECHERLLRIASEYSTALAPVGYAKRYMSLANKFIKEFRQELVACRIFADQKVIEAGELFADVVSGVEMDLILQHKVSKNDEGFLELDNIATYGPKINLAYNNFLKSIRETAGVQSMEEYLRRFSHPGNKRSDVEKRMPDDKREKPSGESS